MNPREKRNQAIARQQAIVSAAKSENRDLTEEERREFDSLQLTIDTCTREIEAEENSRAGESQTETRALLEAERSRISEINSLCREFDMPEEERDGFINKGTSVDEVRAAVLSHIRKEGAPVATRASVTADESDKFRAAAEDALAMRSGANVENPAPGAKELRSMSLRDLYIESESRSGGHTIGELLRMSGDDLYAMASRSFMNPTAAFPAILDNTIQKKIVQVYNSVPTTFQAWTTKGSLSDFKETKDHEYLIGGAGDFLKVPENGELKHDTPSSELLPTRKLDTYGRQFSMTRQAFINDDIGFISEVPGLYAARAKKTIDKAVYTLLYQNKAIYDGVNLFHANHKNLIGTGAKPSQATIQEIILQMQKQTDPFGEAIYVTPRFIVLPVGYEFDIAVILHSAQVTGSSNNDINPLYNYPITPVQSPVLNALAGANTCPWFMVSDPASARGIQVDYLNGQETPNIRRMETPGVLGFVWDIYLDWGISVRDFRGIAKNPGVVI